jgi:hypothetical protein
LTVETLSFGLWNSFKEAPDVLRFEVKVILFEKLKLPVSTNLSVVPELGSSSDSVLDVLCERASDSETLSVYGN